MGGEEDWGGEGIWHMAYGISHWRENNHLWQAEAEGYILLPLALP